MSVDQDHLDSKIERPCYAKVSAQEISAEVRGRVDDTIKFVCLDLGLAQPPKIVWIRPGDAREAASVLVNEAEDEALEELKPGFTRLRRKICEGEGYTPGNHILNEIWIRTDLTAFPDLEYVVAHEVRHHWQKRFRRPVFDVEHRADGDAYPYGYEVLTRYLVVQGKFTSEVREKIETARSNAERVFRAEWPYGTFATISAPPGGKTANS